MGRAGLTLAGSGPWIMDPLRSVRLMQDRGYGVLLPVGLFLGLGIGLAVGEPSAGTLIGLAIAGLVAVALRFLRR